MALDAGDRPLVSVIVATRDRPELLRAALAAVEAQDYEGPIECLVVFDQADPDRSLERTDPGRAVRVLVNRRTPGLAGARNTGIEAAAGEFVAFCDDDDEWRPDKLRRQVDALGATPGADVAVSGVLVDYEGRVTERVPATPVLRFDDLLRSRVMEAHPSSVVARRRAVLDRIGLVDEAIPGAYGEDYEWMLRASRATTVVCVQAPLVRVLWHRASYFAQRWRTIIDAVGYLVDKYPEFRREPRGLARLYGRTAFAHAALGERGEAWRWAVRTLRLDWRERRAYLALLVSTRLVPSGAVLRVAHSFGRGV